jgi:hypothetical protein
MRIRLSALAAAAVASVAMAQDRPRPPDAPPTPAERQLKELTERLRVLEAKLKAHEAQKEEPKKEGEKHIEVVVDPKKKGDKKPDAAKKPEPKKEGGVLELIKDGVIKSGEGNFPGVIRITEFAGDKKPKEKKEGEKKPEPKKESRPEGQPNPVPLPIPAMRGQPGMGFGGGGPMGGGFGPGGPPGFEKLTKEEQAQFQKLMAKMRGGDQQPMRMEMRVIERREEGDRGERREPETRRPEGGERRPNLEERLERLERAIEEIRRDMRKK